MLMKLNKIVELKKSRKIGRFHTQHTGSGQYQDKTIHTKE